MIPTPHLDDEGLSAVLDGLGDPDETQHARECVECQDRLAQWDAARQLLASPVPPAPEDVRRAALAAATTAARAPARSEPVPLLRRVRLVQSVTGIAAALVVAGAVYAVVHDNHGLVKSRADATGERPPTATSIGAANGSSGSVAPGSGGNAGSAGGSPAFAPAASSLGSFTSPPPLVAALKQALGRAAPSSSNGSASAPTALLACSSRAAAAAGKPPGGMIFTAGVTYANQVAEAYVYPRPGGDVAVVVRVVDCHVLTTANF